MSEADDDEFRFGHLLVEETGMSEVDLAAVHQVADVLASLANEVERLRADHQRVTDLVDAQAEDGGLWFDAMTAPEAYLQQELRRLHEACETREPIHSSVGSLTEADDERG